MSYLLGLDVGTTGVRCVAIDEKGIVQDASSVEHPSYAPRPGWSEQEPEDWWKGSRQMIAQVTSRVGRDIKGIGLTGQMHGAVFLDPGDQGHQAGSAVERPENGSPVRSDHRACE